MKKLIGVLFVATFVMTMSVNAFISKNEGTKNEVSLSSLLSIASASAEDEGSCNITEENNCASGQRVCCIAQGKPHI